MTYCLAIKVDQGLVFASDSRTNAGMDHVSTYRKMHIFQRPGERVFVMLSVGNLATTQAVIYRMEKDFESRDPARGLNAANDVVDAAEMLGSLSYAVQQEYSEALAAKGESADASFIIGGQIKGRPFDLCLVYAPGNHIRASAETPYLQVGEIKYGKPILDRVISPSTHLNDAARCALVSLDSTIRANISVGPPLDMAIYHKDQLAIGPQLSLAAEDPFYLQIKVAWEEGLKRAFLSLPKFSWEQGA